MLCALVFRDESTNPHECRDGCAEFVTKDLSRIDERATTRLQRDYFNRFTLKFRLQKGNDMKNILDVCVQRYL